MLQRRIPITYGIYGLRKPINHHQLTSSEGETMSKQIETKETKHFNQLFYSCPGAWTGCGPDMLADYDGHIVVDPHMIVPAIDRIRKSRMFDIDKTEIVRDGIMIRLTIVHKPNMADRRIGNMETLTGEPHVEVFGEC
jgi:hypothetical protein